jgi:hypothetical protein
VSFQVETINIKFVPKELSVDSKFRDGSGAYLIVQVFDRGSESFKLFQKNSCFR